MMGQLGMREYVNRWAILDKDGVSVEWWYGPPRTWAVCTWFLASISRWSLVCGCNGYPVYSDGPSRSSMFDCPKGWFIV